MYWFKAFYSGVGIFVGCFIILDVKYVGLFINISS